MIAKILAFKDLIMVGLSVLKFIIDWWRTMQKNKRLEEQDEKIEEDVKEIIKDVKKAKTDKEKADALRRITDYYND